MSNEKQKMNNKKRDKFVRYSEGAEMYHIRDLEKCGCIHTEQRFRTKGGKSSLMFLIE